MVACLVTLAAGWIALSVSDVHAGDCPPRQQRLTGECVDQQIVNFVKCLETTSKGQLTTRSTARQTGGASSQSQVAGGVSLVKVGVQGEVAIGRTNLLDVVKSAETTFGPDIVQSCKELALTAHSRGAVTAPAHAGKKGADSADAAVREQIQLGADYFESGREEAALAAFQQAFDLSGRKSPEAAGRLGLVERTKSDRDAEFHLKLALDNVDDLWVRAHRTALEAALDDVRSRLKAPPPATGATPSSANRPAADSFAGGQVANYPAAGAVVPGGAAQLPPGADQSAGLERTMAPPASDRLQASTYSPTAASCTGLRPYLHVDDVRASVVNGNTYNVTLVLRSAIAEPLALVVDRAAQNSLIDDAKRELFNGRADLQQAISPFQPTEAVAKAAFDYGLRVTTAETSTIIFRFPVRLLGGQGAGTRVALSSLLRASVQLRDGTHRAALLPLRCKDIAVQ